MNKNDEERLLQKYNCISDNKLSLDDYKEILPYLNLIMEKILLDDVEIIELVDILLQLKKYQKLTKVSEELIQLIAKILGNDNKMLYQEDAMYFLKNLKMIMLPFYANSPLSKELLSSFLMEYDILINNMVMNMNKDDLVLLNNYNADLYEVVVRCKYLSCKYMDSELVEKLSSLDGMIIDNTLAHLGTIFYLTLDKYDYHYDLLCEVFDKIMHDYPSFAYYCSVNGIYQNILDFNPDSEKVINEYKMCQNMLEYSWNPPIKIKKQ